MNADTSDLRAWETARDEAALERLIARHVGMVATVCRRQLGDGAAADEATQATCIILARRAGTIGKGEAVGAWLYEVATNVCRTARRSSVRRSRNEHEAAVHVLAERCATTAAPTGWDAVRPQLDDALGALNAGQRAAVVGHYLEGLPQATIAAQLGISENAVQKRIAYALERLRGWFVKHGVVVGVSALATGLASEMCAVEPALIASCTQAAVHPATVAGASTLAAGVGGVGMTKVAMLLIGGTLAVMTGTAVVIGRSLAGTPPEQGASQVQANENPPPGAVAPGTTSLGKLMQLVPSDVDTACVNGRFFLTTDVQELLGLDVLTTKQVNAELATLSSAYEGMLTKHPPTVTHPSGTTVVLTYQGLHAPIQALKVQSKQLFTAMVKAKQLTQAQAEFLRKYATGSLKGISVQIDREYGWLEKLELLTVELEIPQWRVTIATKTTSGSVSSSNIGIKRWSEDAWFYLPSAGIARDVSLPEPAPRMLPARVGDPDRVPLSVVATYLKWQPRGIEALRPSAGRLLLTGAARDLCDLDDRAAKQVEASYSRVYQAFRAAVAAKPPRVTTQGATMATLDFQHLGELAHQLKEQEQHALDPLVAQGILVTSQAELLRVLNEQREFYQFEQGGQLTIGYTADGASRSWSHKHTVGNTSGAGSGSRALEEEYRFALSFVTFAQDEALPPVPVAAPAQAEAKTF